MKEFHTEQLIILQKLLYSNGLKYSQMKPLVMEGSRFTYHLDQLQKLKLVIKNKDLYSLTNKGKELANRMDLGDEKISNQAKISVLLVCIKQGKVEKEFLLYTRLKSPFYSYQGFPTGKVKIGESIIEAAKRELKEETGLIAQPKLFSIRHYRISNVKGILLEDKIFFACKFLDPKGELVNNPEGSYQWVKESNVWDYLYKPVPEIKEVFTDLKKDSLVFYEGEYSTEGF